MTSSTRETELKGLLDEAASHEFSQVADRLEGLRSRLKRDALSTDEWNALVGAAHHLRCEALKRSRSPKDSELREALVEAREALETSHGAVQDAFSQADAEARDHMKIAGRHDAGVRAYFERRRNALAKIDRALNEP